MNIRTQNFFALLFSATVFFTSSVACAAPLTVFNPGFESPAFTDGNFDFLLTPAQQGVWGWEVSDGAFIYNPTALDYATAGGNGTPTGGEGAQVGGIYGPGTYTIAQQLVGSDGIPGNGDDPVLTANTLYTLKVSIGQRLAGNQYGVSYGGYDLRLVAGLGKAAAVIAQETDAVVPPAGTLVERTVVVDSSKLAPNLLGLPLTIVLAKPSQSATSNIDFDNVSLDAVLVPEPASWLLAVMAGLALGMAARRRRSDR